MTTQPSATASQDLDHVGFSHIIKWLPSSLRSRNAGPDNCLDNGKRDVRLQCQSADHVAVVINELKYVVKVGSCCCSISCAAPAPAQTDVWQSAHLPSASAHTCLMLLHVCMLHNSRQLIPMMRLLMLHAVHHAKPR